MISNSSRRIAEINLDQANQCRWDAAVVGAGPAGAVAAREMARRGAAVLLIDKSKFPRPKVCGGCLNGAALAALKRTGLGELPERLGSRPLRRWQFYAPSGQVNSELPTGVSVPRDAFDAALVEAAIETGVSFLPETTATSLEHVEALDALQIGVTQESRSDAISAATLIVADGLTGRLLDDRPEFKVSVARGARLGAGAILAEGPDFFVDGVIYMACGRGGYVGLVRLEDGRLIVSAALDRSYVRQHGVPAAAAANILATANVPIPPGIEGAAWRGTPPLTRRRARVAGERVFVIGDAAGYVEPFTGEGMAWALQSALTVAPLAVEAARDWSPAFARRWIKQHRALVARQWRCRMLGFVLRRPLLTKGVVRSVARFPSLAAPMVRAVSMPPKELRRREIHRMQVDSQGDIARDDAGPLKHGTIGNRHG